MATVLKFEKPARQQTQKPRQSQKKSSDIYCSPLTYDDGRTIYGAAAREARIKAMGGMEKALRDTFKRATAMAAAGRKVA